MWNKCGKWLQKQITSSSAFSCALLCLAESDWESCLWLDPSLGCLGAFGPCGAAPDRSLSRTRVTRSGFVTQNASKSCELPSQTLLTASCWAELWQSLKWEKGEGGRGHRNSRLCGCGSEEHHQFLFRWLKESAQEVAQKQRGRLAWLCSGRISRHCHSHPGRDVMVAACPGATCSRWLPDRAWRFACLKTLPELSPFKTPALPVFISLKGQARLTTPCFSLSSLILTLAQ